MATDAPQPPADQIQYLSPAQPGFAPKYDYIALLQSLYATAGVATPNLDQLHRHLTPNRGDSDCRALLIDSSGSILWDWELRWFPKEYVSKMDGCTTRSGICDKHSQTKRKRMCAS
jgi:hypothetical protein